MFHSFTHSFTHSFIFLFCINWENNSRCHISGCLSDNTSRLLHTSPANQQIDLSLQPIHLSPGADRYRASSGGQKSGRIHHSTFQRDLVSVDVTIYSSIFLFHVYLFFCIVCCIWFVPVEISRDDTLVSLHMPDSNQNITEVTPNLTHKTHLCTLCHCTVRIITCFQCFLHSLPPLMVTLTFKMVCSVLCVSVCAIVCHISIPTRFSLFSYGHHFCRRKILETKKKGLISRSSIEVEAYRSFSQNKLIGHFFQTPLVVSPFRQC